MTFRVVPNKMYYYNTLIVSLQDNGFTIPSNVIANKNETRNFMYVGENKIFSRF